MVLVTVFMSLLAVIVVLLIVRTMRLKQKRQQIAKETTAATSGSKVGISWEKPGSGIWIPIVIIAVLVVVFLGIQYYRATVPYEIYGDEITLDAGEISPPFRLDVGFKYSYATNRKIKVFNVRYPQLYFYAYPGFKPESNTAFNGEYRIMALQDCKVTVLRSLAD